MSAPAKFERRGEWTGYTVSETANGHGRIDRVSASSVDEARARAELCGVNRKPNWNCHDAPGVANAQTNLVAFRRVARLTGLQWCEPHVTASIEGDPVFEWWRGKKKLTIYFHERSAEYVKVWGPNVHSEMEDGELCDFLPLLQWLTT